MPYITANCSHKDGCGAAQKQSAVYNGSDKTWMWRQAMVAVGNDWLPTDFLGRNEPTWKRPRRIKSAFEMTSLLDVSRPVAVCA